MAHLNTPFWLQGVEHTFAQLAGELDVDVAVLGAGITGTTTAHLLGREGMHVALLEAGHVGCGATGYTTAKLTAGHGLVYTDLVDDFGVEAAARYARSNQEAIERVAAIVDEHGIECDFERAANYVYVESNASAAEIEREVGAARAAGLAAERTNETDLPYRVATAIRLGDQAQFHPWRYVSALARLVAASGGHVHERTRALRVRSGTPCVVETASGRVRARHVVVATQLPFLDRGLFFARAHPVKSYAVAATVADADAPRGMYISADEPKRSVRSTPAGDGRRVLIVGGEGGRPGEGPDGAERYARLERFLQERFGVAAEYRWSTHDFVPLDGLPYIGRLLPGEDRILVATGFAKWGMTKGTLAATMLTDAIRGRPNEYADLYSASRIDARRSVPRFAAENGRVGLAFVRDRVRPRDGRAEVDALAPGEGTVCRIGRKHYAVHRDDAGRLHSLSARCPHLGCIVGWNAADRAWECPCHGSRFAADGTLVQGPATADLPADSLP